MSDMSAPPAQAEIVFPPLDLDRPVAEQIFEAIKTAILTTALPPGCLISEAEIGARFGASRTPVREAFTQLRDDGLIITRPSRGNYVSKLSEQRIREAQFVREALETANVARLCETGLPGAIHEEIEEVLTQQARHAKEGDDLGFQRTDDQFHALLARATGFGRAETLLNREKAALDRLRVFALTERHHSDRLLGEHRAILEAILAGDAAAADSVLRAHLRSVLALLSGMIAAHRDHFE
ncbi:GntR family transcriptional regulator [Limimaricola pyoseonensis]|uniref:DNA-binding transcriptional regulator, GntR family n=1 Tax=Limimaricola pyoseonensis TaxID=521013 RepID=A0A1G7EY40_9RHOB|nr:GntR family transcriptional regulator [Limimaricola pyoseonensis]SDE68571.1 DNA-binding transcriptional regulator, GntR family [Limimaricola pyoseonensis]